MFSTSRNEKMAEVLTGAERRRRRTPQEKITMVQQTFEPGMTVSHVARLHDVNANQLFNGANNSRKALSRRSPPVRMLFQPQSWLLPSSRSESSSVCSGRRPWRTRSSKKLWRLVEQKNGLRMRPCCRGTTIKGGEPSPWCIACAAIRSCSSKTWLARWPAASPTR